MILSVKNLTVVDYADVEMCVEIRPGETRQTASSLKQDQKEKKTSELGPDIGVSRMFSKFIPIYLSFARNVKRLGTILFGVRMLLNISVVIQI